MIVVAFGVLVAGAALAVVAASSTDLSPRVDLRALCAGVVAPVRVTVEVLRPAPLELSAPRRELEPEVLEGVVVRTGADL